MRYAVISSVMAMVAAVGASSAEPAHTSLVVYRVGGLSHFSLIRDYPRLALLYARLVVGGVRRSSALRQRAAGASGIR
jgi:hypothetical protein